MWSIFGHFESWASFKGAHVVMIVSLMQGMNHVTHQQHMIHDGRVMTDGPAHGICTRLLKHVCSHILLSQVAFVCGGVCVCQHICISSV